MAVTIANTGTFNQTISSPTHTLALTLSAGTNRKAVAMVLLESSVTVTGVTWDGNAMSAVNGATITNATLADIKAYTFYYDIGDGVGTGSKNIVATTSAGTLNATVYGWHLSGAVTGAPEDAQETQWTTTSQTGTLTFTRSNGAAILAAAVDSPASTTWTWSGTATIAERAESNEANYTSACADGIQAASGSATVIANNNNAGAGNKCLVGISVAESAGPTITVQPVAQTKVLTNANTATFSVTATGTGSLAYDWELEDGVASGVYANLANGNGATWTGQTASSCTGTFTAKTLSGRRVRCNVTDDNGTTTSNAVTLTLFDGPQVTTFGPTNGSGVSTATLTCDYVTGVGEAIEVAIVLPDGRLAVTTTTT